MGQLYKIKPLEWIERSDGDCFVRNHYQVYLTVNGGWGYSGIGLATGRKASKEAAKAACEDHRRNLLDAELEPAYQPSNALPTEPGHYWWRRSHNSKWTVIQIFRADTGTLFAGHKPLEVYSQDHYQGSQWIRIPEPEK